MSGWHIVGLIGLALLIACALRLLIGHIQWLRERRGHDDLDYQCIYWWGDRAGSLQARCRVCNPPDALPQHESRRVIKVIGPVTPEQEREAFRRLMEEDH